MCLAVPAKLLSIEGDEGIVDLGGIKRKVNLVLVDKSKLEPGKSYVIVHAGFAISIMDEKEALKTLEIWKEILAEE